MAIDLPGGTYALTEIIYKFFNVDSAARVVERYCLSKATIAFDIQNGETSYLGAFAVADLPDNRARLRKHTPIQSIDRSLDTATGEASRIEDLQLTKFDGIAFEATDGICESSDYHTTAWKIRR